MVSRYVFAMRVRSPPKRTPSRRRRKSPPTPPARNMLVFDGSASALSSCHGGPMPICTRTLRTHLVLVHGQLEQRHQRQRLQRRRARGARAGCSRWRHRRRRGRSGGGCGVDSGGRGGGGGASEVVPQHRADACPVSRAQSGRAEPLEHGQVLAELGHALLHLGRDLAGHSDGMSATADRGARQAIRNAHAHHITRHHA